MEDKMKVSETSDELEKVLNKVFGDDDATITYDEATEELSAFIGYDMKIDFHVNDIREKLADGTLEVWTKGEVGRALLALAEMILEKVKELDG